MENLVFSMPKKGLLSVDQAISAIVKKILPLKKEEKIKLSDSLGRILSKNVISKRNNPSEDTSAMDGFAINIKNSTNEFKIIGESSAGNPFVDKVGKNETYLKRFINVNDTINPYIIFPDLSFVELPVRGDLNSVPLYTTSYQRVIQYVYTLRCSIGQMLKIL